MQKRTYKVTLALATILSSATFASAVNAEIITNVVREVVDNTGHLVHGSVTASGDIVDGSGHVVGRAVSGSLDTAGNILDTSGRVVGKVTGSGNSTIVVSDALSSSIDSRRIAYDAMLSDAIAQNRLNAAQAAEYRATLQRIVNAESEAKLDNTLTYAEAQSLADQLDSLGSSISTVPGIRHLTPLIISENGNTRISVTPTYYAPSEVIASGDTTTTTTMSTTTVGSAPVVTPVGTTVLIGTATPELYITTIETRRKDLDKAIDHARDSGQVTPERARLMKAELKRIAIETGTNKITYSRAVMLAQDLDLIGTGLTTVSTSAAYVPIIQGSHFTVYNGQILQLDDLSIRRAELESRITKDYLQGRLNETQAANLRLQLDAIGATANVYRQTGGIDFKESKALYKDFDHVASEIEKIAGKDNK